MVESIVTGTQTHHLFKMTPSPQYKLVRPRGSYLPHTVKDQSLHCTTCTDVQWTAVHSEDMKQKGSVWQKSSWCPWNNITAMKSKFSIFYVVLLWKTLDSLLVIAFKSDEAEPHRHPWPDNVGPRLPTDASDLSQLPGSKYMWHLTFWGLKGKLG